MLSEKTTIDRDDTISYKAKDGKKHTIKLSSALEYDKDHPAYREAQKYIEKQSGEKKEKGNVTTAQQHSDLPPIPKSPTNWGGPTSDATTISKQPGTAVVERKIVSMLNKLAEAVRKAKERGQDAPEYDLCQISIPGTNMFCGNNLGIPRENMPQLKGKVSNDSIVGRLARQNSPLVKVKRNENGDIVEADAEELFKAVLVKKGHTMTPKRVPADTLRATQSELVGSKVAGMMKALEENPENKGIRAPIFVSKDGYVLDGHHRWASLVALQMSNGSGEDIEMDVVEVDMTAKELVGFTNRFTERVGIQQKKAKVKEIYQRLGSIYTRIMENVS